MGRIVGLYGVKGWVRVFSHTDPREAILDYDRWFLKKDAKWNAAAVAQGKRHGKSVIVRLHDIVDREEARELIGCDVAVERSDMPTPDEGSYYWSDLEGMQVVRRDGIELGRVAYLLETGANDVLVTAGEQERLIPFIAEDIILDVDVAKGVITVDWEWD